MDPTKINLIAVLVAALSSFVMGGIWYSPLLFAKPWMKDTGLTEDVLAQGNTAKILGGAFVLAVVIALNLAFFLGADAGWLWGLTAGALAGVGWVAASMGTTFLFERKPLRLILIDTGYHAATYALMGAIIGAWQ